MSYYFNLLSFISSCFHFIIQRRKVTVCSVCVCADDDYYSLAPINKKLCVRFFCYQRTAPQPRQLTPSVTRYAVITKYYVHSCFCPAVSLWHATATVVSHFAYLMYVIHLSVDSEKTLKTHRV